MNKTLKILLNILVFLLIAGFGYYMIRSIISGDKATPSNNENAENTFVSPYKKISSFELPEEIIRLELYDNTFLLAAVKESLYIYDTGGELLGTFPLKPDIRDITIDESGFYVLYPTYIEVYNVETGEFIREWEACSDNSDYCAITTTKDDVFVTDAENKNIVQYDKQGGLVRFIKSPNGFIIPSHAFDIININDTIYCANSGRHRIESYTPDGEFIASVGKSGAGAGAFAGCCNPVYLAKSSDGHILTSEKGNPRISCFSKDGKFRTILFDAKMLGGGTSAYKIQASDEYIFIANRKTISIYGFDAALSEKKCDGCLMRKKCG
jgi:hypothetical protein